MQQPRFALLENLLETGNRDHFGFGWSNLGGGVLSQNYEELLVFSSRRQQSEDRKESTSTLARGLSRTELSIQVSKKLFGECCASVG